MASMIPGDGYQVNITWRAVLLPWGAYDQGGSYGEWLDARGATYADRDIVADNPTADELRQWHERSGLPLKRFFNTSGMAYREMGLSKRLSAMDEAAQYDLLATDGMLVKRPLLVTEATAIPGFKEDAWSAALGA